MERLIEKNQDLAWIKGHLSDSCTEMCEEVHGECWRCDIMVCMERLADYEEAKEQGRLIEFPVAVGDHVWCIPPEDADAEDITEMTIESLEHNKYGDSINLETSTSQLPIWFNIEQIGRLVFLSREEAEAKLKEMEAGNANT